MRILVVSDWYPANEGDPAGSFVRSQALAVSAAHEVAVLHLAAPARGAARLRLDAEQDGPLYTLRLCRRPGAPVTAGNVAALAMALRHLRRRSFVPDLLHAHEVGSGFAATTRGGARRRPTVVSVHTSDFALGGVRGATALLARATFARADAVCPVSESLRERLEGTGWTGRFRVVPNVVDTERFAPGAALDEDGVPRIVTVALLQQVKGVADLVEAAGILVRRGLDFRIDLIGDGPLREPLTLRIRELGLSDRVVLHGTLPPAEVAACMRAAAFAVVPSLWETFCVVLSEAMACGLPVVATAVGALPERVDERNGILVGPGDPEALAAGIAQMLERHRSYDRAGIAAAARERFSPAAVAAHWDEVYREALAHRAAPRRRVARRRARD